MTFASYNRVIARLFLRLVIAVPASFSLQVESKSRKCDLVLQPSTGSSFGHLDGLLVGLIGEIPFLYASAAIVPHLGRGS